MNNFYYGSENLPGVNDILGVDRDIQDDFPSVPKEGEDQRGLYDNEIHAQNVQNKPVKNYEGKRYSSK